MHDEFAGDFAFIPFDTLYVNKTRMYGSCGFVDTLECVFAMYQESVQLRMLPLMKVDSAKALV